MIIMPFNRNEGEEITIVTTAIWKKITEIKGLPVIRTVISSVKIITLKYSLRLVALEFENTTELMMTVKKF